MNLMILSRMRCGSSWVGKVLSDTHEVLKGKPIEWGYERFRPLASKTLLKGFNSVHDVDPKILLNLGYTVICIERDLETMKRVHALFFGYADERGYESLLQERPAFFEKIELYHKLLYGQNIKHKRYLQVRLEDLNNYTSDTFKEIIDFLGWKMSFRQKIKFLIKKRNILIVATAPPERNWEIYSDFLAKGHEVCPRLKQIEITTKKEVKI